MTKNHGAIRTRAIAFAQSSEWQNPVIIADDPADPTLVADRGTGDPTEYRRFRIEVDMRDDRREQVLELARGPEKEELERFLDGKWTMDVTCSATDIIAVNFPYVD